MNTAPLTAQEIGERGRALYDRDIRARVEPGNLGKFLVLDVDTGEYEIDADQIAAFDRATARNPSENRYLIRIGFVTAHAIDSRLTMDILDGPPFTLAPVG